MASSTNKSVGMFSKNTLMSALGNFSTAYNFQSIAVALSIAHYVYPEDKNTWSHTESVTKTIVLVGAIVGQLTMGYVGDWLGRSRAMALTMALTITGALLSSINTPYGDVYPGPYVCESTITGASTIHHQFVWLSLTRFILGVGVGGVYPLAATVAAESSKNNKERGKQVSLVFSTQGLGFVMAPIMGLIVVAANPSSKVSDPSKLGVPGLHECLMPYQASGLNNSCVWPSPDCNDGQTHCAAGANDINWRFVLAIGALPGIVMLPFKVSETSASASDPMRKSTFWADISRREYWPKLIGTAGSWFLFDIVFYGNTLFKGAVTAAMFNDVQSLHTEFVHSTILFAIALPGYWVATALMEILGRKNIQMLGFGMMYCARFILYVTLSQLTHREAGGKVEKKSGVSAGGLLFLYGLTFFFANFGPNSTTFILPSETFPAEVRSSLNGFSAAMGKTGAALGTAGFLPLAKQIGAPNVILVCGIISLLGLINTYFFVEDRRNKSMATSNSTMGYSSINASESTRLLNHPADQ